MPTTSTRQPAVPLPAAAVSGDVWEGGERVVMGPRRNVGRRPDIHVRTYAIQRTDGRITRRPEPPGVFVYLDSDQPITAARARQLAAALLDAADQADAWAAS
ncbi:MAG: hypothetical protein VX424_02160 [Actinomycetota bacterium]|nr:hypothetical protein [Actinomycetota bacterium]